VFSFYGLCLPADGCLFLLVLLVLSLFVRFIILFCSHAVVRLYCSRRSYIVQHTVVVFRYDADVVLCEGTVCVNDANEEDQHDANQRRASFSHD
jgi:hypothetical protein